MITENKERKTDARIERLRKERVGLKNKNTAGFKMTIIEYMGSRNITVQFDDGTIVSNRSYDDFLQGHISNPNQAKINKLQNEREGARKQMNSGLWAFVKEYRRADDIDVEFEIDGAINKGKSWMDFNRGKIAHPSVAPNYDRKLHVGEIKEMNNGLKAKIIAYRRHKDIDVMFLDDGFVVSGTAYTWFARGIIAHPNKQSIHTMSLQEFGVQYYLSKLGFSKVHKGEWKQRGFGNMELDFYNDKFHVAIEVDGAIHGKKGAYEKDLHKNLLCEQLNVKLYRLRDQYLDVLQDNKSINFILHNKNRIKGTLLIDCKKELEQILIENNIIFSEDFINFQRDLEDILNQYKNTIVNTKGQEHIGERIYHNSSQQYMTLVEYHNTRCVDIVFDDGVKRNSISYSSFRNGHVKHPNISISDIRKKQVRDGRNPLISKSIEQKINLSKQRIGEQSINRAGQIMTIIRYNNCHDIDVQFEDGRVARGVAYGNFKNGRVGHPSRRDKTTTNKETNI